MNRITLDAELRAKLNGLKDIVEICDEGGKVVGRYLPEAEYLYLVYEILKLQPIDEEETRQIREEMRRDGGMTTAEAIEHLEKVAREWRGKA